MTNRPRILYLCEWQGESGGIKVLYDHVAALRELGHDAYLAARGPFERCAWFDDHSVEDTPSFDLERDGLRTDDLLVVADVAVGTPGVADIPCRRVAIVQNPKFLGGPLLDSEFEATLVPSHPLIDWLREATGFKGPVHVAPSFVEQRWFGPERAMFNSTPRVLLTHRDGKHMGEPFFAAGVLHYENIPITFVTDPVPRAEFVQRFREHDIYMHLSYPEGLPMPPFEAMANDCLVIGFAGIGGLEYMRHKENSLVFDDGDWLSAVKAVLELRDGGNEDVARMLKAARATAASFDWDNMTTKLQGVFETLLGSRAGGAS